MEKGKKMRLVDKDSLMERCITYINGDRYVAEWRIESEPEIDAVEVVRCVDCKWSKRDTLLDKHWCKHFFGEMEVRENDYCSYGERKEDADD